jgi:heme-degrading monooxygenase HmoA
MPAIVKNADYATFINVFKCKPRDQHEVVRINAEIIDRVAVRCHGFISASIHHSTDGTRVFKYLQWESPEHLASMQDSTEFRELGRHFAGLIEFEAHQCEVVHIGEARPDDGV